MSNYTIICCPEVNEQMMGLSVILGGFLNNLLHHVYLIDC
jgi:hypothetical protein